MTRAPPDRPAAAAGGSHGSDTGDRPDRPRSNDLGLELYRQRTLLQIMTARMRETSSGIERGAAFDPARARRALDVHRRYLLEVHEVDAERLVSALSEGKVKAAAELGRELEHAKGLAVAFERDAEALLSKGVAPGSESAHRLSQLFTTEAERVDRHQLWEAERLHAKIDEWFPKSTQTRLLNQIRKFDSGRVDAEIALISWASQLHPSSD